MVLAYLQKYYPDSPGLIHDSFEEAHHGGMGWSWPLADLGNGKWTNNPILVELDQILSRKEEVSGYVALGGGGRRWVMGGG